MVPTRSVILRSALSYRASAQTWRDQGFRLRCSHSRRRSRKNSSPRWGNLIRCRAASAISPFTLLGGTGVGTRIGQPTGVVGRQDVGKESLVSVDEELAVDAGGLCRDLLEREDPDAVWNTERAIGGERNEGAEPARMGRTTR